MRESSWRALVYDFCFGPGEANTVLVLLQRWVIISDSFLSFRRCLVVLFLFSATTAAAAVAAHKLFTIQKKERGELRRHYASMLGIVPLFSHCYERIGFLHVT